MIKQPFTLEKRFSFLLANIDISIDFLVLKKKKTKMYSVDSCRSSTFRKDQEKQSEKFGSPVHQIEKCKKRQEWVVSTSTGKHILQGALVTKEKLRSDFNTISDLLRNEKYLDNDIHIFHLL